MIENEIKFCKRCLYGNSHPLGITLDEEGICSGCRIHEEKDRLDWNDRWSKLVSVCNAKRRFLQHRLRAGQMQKLFRK